MDAQTLTHQRIDPSTIKPENIWANYDKVSDTLLVYVTGKPVPSSVEWLDNHMGVLLDDDDAVVGFQIDHFEYAWLPAHGEVAKAWATTRRTLFDEGWNNLLRMLATVILMLSLQFSQDDNAALAPA